MEIDEPAIPLPSATTTVLSTGITLQPPLSRRGHGPGLIVVVPGGFELAEDHITLDPAPQQKWAEEGYAVAQIELSTKLDELSLKDAIRTAANGLTALSECETENGFGLILYDSSVIVLDGNLDHVALSLLLQSVTIRAIVTYGPFLPLSISQLVHLPGPGAQDSTEPNVKIHKYPETSSPYFIIPKHRDFIASSAAVAHTRTLTFLKSKLGGPVFDLEAIWDEHTYFEFGDRSVARTMGTMVQEPYVNHIPTMTGGIGRERLTNFYRYHFIWNNPKDTRLDLVSRTVGIDRVIDEFIFCFTHDEVIDWLAPGIPPTGQAVRLPMVSVVNIRGDKLYHEHIWWDQACLLRQLGLLPDYLPFPYALPNGNVPAEGKRFEYRLPVSGIECSEKLADENSIESNGMFGYKVREVETFCSKGTYCTDGGCCPNNMKLEECKAAQTYTVISQTPTPSAKPTTVLTTRVTRTSTLVLTDTVVLPPSSPTPPSNTTVIRSTGTGTGTGTSWPRPTGGWNATMTTPGMPPQQTTNTAARVQGVAAALGLSIVVALAGTL
ncbi:hypothetical protein LOZ57_005327 [Ophidiomyces ophidiicola]|uniref:uncharacterized protein n=1 Tax=Ophidiomyces ophidiicola TaxID=1387563 RepID=UPI0020C4ABF4|nr:uncharacterized protein LOZ57_005327 [Ophidiomyces ophidiicola]KAI1942303.1 hypothetical protein LOZ57_005327 [Ophidiomyces ophidiicola]KAI2057692.1 hypothetical protein LOZ43_002984 [Ophidiomyces ophidiicola]